MWIGTHCFDANPDPDRHQNGKSDTDPDRHKNDADPQDWKIGKIPPKSHSSALYPTITVHIPRCCRRA
jgi:hypothetical protein